MLAANRNREIFEVVQPGQGGQIEILIAWQERILQTCHYPVGPRVSIGSKANIILPLGTMVRNFNLIDGKNGQAFIHLPFEAKNYLQKNGQRIRLTEAFYQLQQNEVVFISFGNDINLAIRYAPLTKKISLAPLLFSSAEYTAMLAALILTTLTSFVVSVFSQKPKKAEEKVERIVEVHFEPPIIKLPNTTVIEETPKPIEVEIKPIEVEPKVVKLDPTQTENKPKLISKVSKPVSKRNLHKASVPTVNVATSQMQSKDPDPTQLGLISVFSHEGIRKKMDQAYNGSGELMGLGEKASGVSGYKDSQSGDDIGKKLKNVGENGKGAATLGIGNLKLSRAGFKEAGALQSSEFGSKEQTQIAMGGSEEGFVGTIDREAVRRAVKNHLPAIKNCFEREYKKNSSLQGKIVVAWEIHQPGEARRIRIVSELSTMKNPVVESCVAAVIGTIRFPEPPDQAVVEVTGFPFVFSGNP